MKKVRVIISGAPAGQNLREIELPSGAMVLDFLQALGLSRAWTVTREGSFQRLALEEELDGHIADGCILRVSPQCCVSNS